VVGGTGRDDGAEAAGGFDADTIDGMARTGAIGGGGPSGSAGLADATGAIAGGGPEAYAAPGGGPDLTDMEGGGPDDVGALGAPVAP
jgi:hypothetical protein